MQTLQNFLNGLNPGALALFGTLSGAFLGFLSALLVTWLTKRFEERKHYREALLTAATHQRRQDFDAAVTTKTQQALMPLEYYLARMIQLENLLQNRKLSQQQMLDELKRLDEWNIKAAEYYEPYVRELLTRNDDDEHDLNQPKRRR
jgi:hypothetical protein